MRVSGGCPDLSVRFFFDFGTEGVVICVFWIWMSVLTQVYLCWDLCIHKSGCSGARVARAVEIRSKGDLPSPRTNWDKVQENQAARPVADCGAGMEREMSYMFTTIAGGDGGRWHFRRFSHFFSFPPVQEVNMMLADCPLLVAAAVAVVDQLGAAPHGFFFEQANAERAIQKHPLRSRLGADLSNDLSKGRRSTQDGHRPDR